MVPESSTRIVGEPAAGGTVGFFVASCLSSQFNNPAKRYAGREDQSDAEPLLIGGLIRQLDGGVRQLLKLRRTLFDARIGLIQQKCELRKSDRRQKFHLIRNGG